MSMHLIIDGVILNDVHKDDLACEAEELDERIASCRERLMMLVASTPRGVSVPDVEGNPIGWVDHLHGEVSGILEELADATVGRHLVMVAMNHPGSVQEVS